MQKCLTHTLFFSLLYFYCGLASPYNEEIFTYSVSYIRTNPNKSSDGATNDLVGEDKSSKSLIV